MVQRFAKTHEKCQDSTFSGTRGTSHYIEQVRLIADMVKDTLLRLVSRSSISQQTRLCVKVLPVVDERQY